MGRSVPHDSVAVPLPGYTDYLKAFPGRGFSINGEQVPTLDQVDAALDAAALVIISNPHNPTGALLPRDALIDLAGRHPQSTLVVDESYINFTADPAAGSCIGCDAANIVVLRSTSKFYGIAATRAGVAWCRDSARLTSLIGRQETWGLSGVDVRVADAAVRSWEWADDVRSRMHDDNRWLAHALDGVPGFDLWANTNVHFQYGWTALADQLAEVFAAHGVGVRPLGTAHGVHPGALRIVAPRADERDLVADAIDAVAKVAADAR
jgi:histidinol-phosphate aminotransferase